LATVAPSLRRRARRTFWKWVYQGANHRLSDPGTALMNYGYAPLEEPYEDLGVAPDLDDERFGIQLYNKVAGAADLRGKDVLEVGCGRGGGATFVFDRFGPRTMTAVDLSEKAMAHCRAVRGRPGLTFATADAQDLPMPDGSFDVVLNVESCHCYADIPRFLSEVHRVLRPGGLLLLADARPTELPERRNRVLVREEDSHGLRRQISASEFDVLEEEDIAPNVFRALQIDSPRRKQLIARRVRKRLQPIAMEFYGVEGSRLYDRYARGEITYLRFVLRRRSAEEPPQPV
jgi:ubiquinone/menaquinone biosynthesis C-methylase UbiE